MKGELLLYGYGLICLSVLVFNILYSFVLKGKDYSLERRKRRYAGRIEEQLAKLREGLPVEQKHMSCFRRKLSQADHLMAYEHALREADSSLIDEYCRQIQPVWLWLAEGYRKRANILAAYFAYFLSVHEKKEYSSDDAMQKIMLEYLMKESLYCRVNALAALYKFGSEEGILEAMRILDGTEGCPQEKILTDGLLTFEGDHSKLITLFWVELDNFSNKMQLAILNYIRFQTGEYCERMLDIMTNPNKDKELRLSAVRYLGRYPYAPAKEKLLAFAGDKESLDWEYSAVSISSLAHYEGEDVVEVLIEAMHRSNWYVRYNAAASLEEQNLNYSDLMQVVGGQDRYAREMIMYRMNLRYLQETEREAMV